MAFRLKRNRPVARELSRIVASELDDALGETRVKGDARPAVHAVRKHVKKLRAVLRLFEEDLGADYRRFNTQLRSVGHRLSALRDAGVLPETLKALRDHYPRIMTAPVFSSADHGLRGGESGSESGPHADRVLRGVSRTLRQTARALPPKIRHAARPRALREGIGHVYRRARKALTLVVDQPEDLSFHAWRRRVKEHWYHMRLLEGLTGRVHARVLALRQLETWLGDDHNLVILRETLLRTPARFGNERSVSVILGCIAKYQTTLRRRALKEGRRLFARKPSDFRKQIERWQQR